MPTSPRISGGLRTKPSCGILAKEHRRPRGQGLPGGLEEARRRRFQGDIHRLHAFLRLCQVHPGAPRRSATSAKVLTVENGAQKVPKTLPSDALGAFSRAVSVHGLRDPGAREGLHVAKTYGELPTAILPGGEARLS